MNNDPLLEFFSEKQLVSIRESNLPFNVWEGSIRSGKTYASLWRFVDEAKHGPPGEFAILCRTYDSFERNVLRELHEILGRHVQYLRGKRQIFIKERKCHVITADDSSAESKIRGCTLAGAYVDEITILPENVFMMFIGRLSIANSKLFGTTNPDSPYHWCKKWMDGNPDVASFKFHLDDNPFIEKDKKDILKRQYRGLWYKRFIDGQWVQAEGAIYDFFSEKEHVIDIPTSAARHYVVGVDYGTANPCAFVLVGYNPHRNPNIWVEDEYYYNSKIHQRQKTDDEYVADLINFIQFRNVQAIYIDPSAASFRAALAKAGVDNLMDADNDVQNGIGFTSMKLGQGGMKICRKCTNLINEFQSYVWDDKSIKLGVDKPKKENDHALDALRYVMYTHFAPLEGNQSKAEDIDRRWRDATGQGPDLPDFFKDPPPDGPFRFI